jgi:hypothetical protein
LYEGRTAPDVNEEGLGRPPTERLDYGWWNSMFGKRCCSSSTHRLPSNGIIEEKLKTRGEERSRRDVTGFRNPEGGGEREKMVPGSEISIEMGKGVMLELISADNDTVALKIAISFVMRKMEFVQVSGDTNGISVNDFPPVLKGLVVWESEFAQA